ncbi:MAG: regulatory protein RecX [Eubacteriaceae bacterium]|jgi:regulatory protein
MEEFNEVRQKMFDQALNYLSFRARTEQEIRSYFEKKKYCEDAISAVIEKLKEYHYLDDTEYVRQYCDVNAFGKRLGRNRVRQDLARRGISDTLLSALSQLIPDEDEQEFCRVHFEKAMQKTEGEPYRRRLPKIQSYLLRRGFGNETVSALLREITEEDCPVDERQFTRHFEHYLTLYSRKGFTGREFQAKVIKAMLSRGYNYDTVREALAGSVKPDE